MALGQFVLGGLEECSEDDRVGKIAFQESPALAGHAAGGRHEDFIGRFVDFRFHRIVVFDGSDVILFR
jgi:hypothetical protein